MQGKTMIFGNWPHELQKTAAFLNAIGIKFLYISPGATQEEVSKKLAMWNDPNDEHEVFLLSTKTAALGLNLHKACHRLICLSMPDNIPTFIQVIGRVHRIGQGRIQYIMLLCQDHSYDQILRAKVVEKFVFQILGDSELKTFASEDVKRAVLVKEYRAIQNKHEARPESSEVEHEFIKWQVHKLICHMLGFRCSPHGWENQDLSVKDKLKSNLNFPGRIRATMPHEKQKLADAQANGDDTYQAGEQFISIGKSSTGLDIFGQKNQINFWPKISSPGDDGAFDG